MEEDNSQPKVSSSPKGSHKSFGPGFFKSIIWLSVAAVIAVLIFVALKAFNNATPGTNLITANQQPVIYSTNKLVDSSVESTLTRIEFKRPQEFTTVKESKQNTTPFKVEYAHQIPDNGGITTLGAIAARTVHPIVSENKPVDTSSVAKTFNQSGDGYKQLLDQLGINDFLKTELSHLFFNNIAVSEINLSINNPSTLTTAYINANAWKLDFNADNNTVKVQGSLVFVLGKTSPVYNAFDYVMLAAVENNWKSNSQVWQQVINSIKITELNKPQND